MLRFIIPLRHPDSSKNWNNVCARLSETVDSIEACCDDGETSAVLVANQDAPLPNLPDCIQVLRVPYPAPAISPYRGESQDAERRRAVWLDKGRKIAAGAIAARSAGIEYLMPVDADDLVSRQIPDYVRAHRGEPG